MLRIDTGGIKNAEHLRTDATSSLSTTDIETCRTAGVLK